MAAREKMSHSDIEALLESRNYRVVQERNDFFLPQIIDFVVKKDWINIQPEYQRRLVWDQRKQSKLIESLFMNVPVPPIFLYEQELSRYEVMDGQQRLNSIVRFYNNEFRLRGLEFWEKLNGLRYIDLPPMVQRALDRRRISATVLTTDGVTNESDLHELRKQVFDRLNTGGQKLKNQELRNCLYSGPFNDLIIELAGNSIFDDLWGIPRYEDNVRAGKVSEQLSANSLFKRMADVEIVLRFFAFFGAKSKIRGAVKSILDQCMVANQDVSEARIDEMRSAFLSAVELANGVFGRHAFHMPEKRGYSKNPSQPFYDAIMVALYRLRSRADELIAARKDIANAVREMFEGDNEKYELFIGRSNTANAIKERLDVMEETILSAL